MGPGARAFWLTLLAYAVIAGVLVARTGGPTGPAESTNGNATAVSNATAAAGHGSNVTTAANTTQDVASAPGTANVSNATNGTSSP